MAARGGFVAVAHVRSIRGGERFLDYVFDAAGVECGGRTGDWSHDEVNCGVWSSCGLVFVWMLNFARGV